MGMAAASDEADYDARNKATGGSCTTDLPGMAAASDGADYDVRNKASGGSCTTDPAGMAAASDEADYDVRNKASGGSFTTDPPASDKAESLADSKGKNGFPTAVEVYLYTPGTPSVSSTGAADDQAGPETKCKDFDGLSSADLAFWDGASLDSPGGGGGMASNLASSAIKRGTDGDAAAPNRKTRKKVKVEKNVA